jgi:hypothetical protein
MRGVVIMRASRVGVAALTAALVAACGSSSTGQKLSGSPNISGSPAFSQDFRTTGQSSACVLTLYGDSTSTTSAFQMRRSGDLLTYVSGPGGEIDRHDVRVRAGAGPLFTFAFPPSSVIGVGATLRLPGGRAIRCTIKQK